jgi:phage terminase small subunit
MAANQETKDGDARFTKVRQSLFLDHLAESSNVTKSAEAAGVSAGCAYALRRKDPDFARRWLAALYEGYIHLELQILERLRDGNMSADDSSKYDFTNAIRLLSAHRENAANAQAQQRNVSAAEVRASIDRKVEAIRQQVQREKRKEDKPG